MNTIIKTKKLSISRHSENELTDIEKLILGCCELPQNAIIEHALVMTVNPHNGRGVALEIDTQKREQ